MVVAGDLVDDINNERSGADRSSKRAQRPKNLPLFAVAALKTADPRLLKASMPNAKRERTWEERKGCCIPYTRYRKKG